MYDLEKVEERAKLIEQMAGTEEKSRKAISLKQTEIYNDRAVMYVYNELCRRYGKKSADKMPLIGSINIAKRIVDQEASLYRDEPERFWSELSEDQHEAVENIINDMKLNDKMLSSNRNYRLQKQSIGMIIPKDGKLICRILRNHHVTVIPMQDDPETAWAYIISSFDKSQDLQTVSKNENNIVGYNYSDSVNQTIGDPDDYKKASTTHVVWTADHHFKMTGKGEIISEEIENPIGMLPFFEAAEEKDFEFWIRHGHGLCDSTVDLNLLMTTTNQVIEMSFGQAMISGDVSIEQGFEVGPTKILHLKPTVNDDGSVTETKFSYATPSSDIAGTISFVEMFLSNLLTARGADPKMINGKAEGTTYSSGVERLLSMIEKFEASRDDMAKYRSAEERCYSIIKAWHNLAIDTDGLLDDKYKTTKISDESEMSIIYQSPEMIQSEDDKLMSAEKRIDMGLSSELMEIMKYYGVSKDEAIEIQEEIRQDNELTMPEPAAPPVIDETVESEDENADNKEQGDESDQSGE